MISISIPWPSRTLHPNARPHWAAKAKAVKKARNDAAWCAREAGIRRGDPDIPQVPKVTAIFSPPDKRPRDLDSMLASLKAAFDGIADAMGVDDSLWEIGAPRRGDPVKHGLVTIEIEEAA